MVRPPRCGNQPYHGAKGKRHGVRWVCQTPDPVTGIQRCLASHINNMSKMCAWGPIDSGRGEGKARVRFTGDVGEPEVYAPSGSNVPRYPVCHPDCAYCHPKKKKNKNKTPPGPPKTKKPRGASGASSSKAPTKSK